MYKRFIIILFISTFYAAEITNIITQQRIDGSGIIDVTYDLLDPDGEFPSFTVLIEMSIDGSEYSSYSLSNMSGDVGENVWWFGMSDWWF